MIYTWKSKYGGDKCQRSATAEECRVREPAAEAAGGGSELGQGSTERDCAYKFASQQSTRDDGRHNADARTC